MISKTEVRSCLVFACGFGVVSLLFTLPMLFAESVTVTSQILGQKTETTGPGIEVAPLLFLFPVMFSVIGALTGRQSRRSRQIKLLAASNPNAPEWLVLNIKQSFFDRAIYRLELDGTDTQRDIRK